MSISIESKSRSVCVKKNFIFWKKGGGFPFDRFLQFKVVFGPFWGHFWGIFSRRWLFFFFHDFVKITHGVLAQAHGGGEAKNCILD